MLRKELCIKCHQNIFTSGWHKSDEKYWKEIGHVFCPSIYLGREEFNIRKITDKPPSKCPFFLEHII